MFKGTVNFEATIRGNGLTFDRFEFVSNEPGVEKVEIEGPTGGEIRTTVYLASVPSRDDGRTLAEKVTTTALNRIGFNHRIAIENARMTGCQFARLHPQPGVIEVECAEEMNLADAVRVVIGIPTATLKSGLEQVSPPGEHYYGLFRSARQSISPVEEFMHLYQILLMILGDNQHAVDAFIVKMDLSVPQTPDPRTGTMETVYTRLRNEFAHKRAGVDLATTKTAMANWLGGLASLTKRAIELNP